MGGFGEYSCAVFGDPAADRYQWVMTGRHITLRADGNTAGNLLLGGAGTIGAAAELLASAAFGLRASG